MVRDKVFLHRHEALKVAASGSNASRPSVRQRSFMARFMLKMFQSALAYKIRML